MHLVAPAPKPLGHQFGSGMFFAGQLWLGVNLVPDGDHFRFVGTNAVERWKHISDLVRHPRRVEFIQRTATIGYACDRETDSETLSTIDRPQTCRPSVARPPEGVNKTWGGPALS